MYRLDRRSGRRKLGAWHLVFQENTIASLPWATMGYLSFVDIDKKSKCVDLQFVTGHGPLLEGIPRSALRYMDKEDVNQAAARIARESTKDE
jgi:hypothetical protein